MLDLPEYSSLGAALRAALERWPNEICLIEADRERENCRLTYRQFKEKALPLARTLQDAGLGAGTRAAIIMTNQSKWLISAYAIFYGGGVLVPLDYKLTAREHLQLLAHSKAEFLVVEYHLWRAITQDSSFASLQTKTVIVTEAPANAELCGAKRWEEFRSEREPAFVERQRGDWACIVYSSGTGGRPKGCVMTHENYLEQCQSLASLFPFWPGVRYLSILPTNHAIDFMIGFIGPFICGATVVHLRTLRPEFIREAFTRYHITYITVVPMILKNLERGLRDRFAALPPKKRKVLDRLIGTNRALTRGRPRLWISRLLLRSVHQAFGGELRAMFVGGAFTEPATLQFLYDLGVPVGNGYGLTEAGTVITVNDFKPFRADTVGKALPGTEVRIVNPGEDGVGEVAARGKTIMSHYLDDPEMTAATIVDGWLMTGDLGKLDAGGHLHLLGRKKNMIVTEGGKNVYPEDIENAFDSLNVKEFCVFAANFIWPQRTMTGEQLVFVARVDDAAKDANDLCFQIVERNRQLPDFKRIGGYLLWTRDFPRTASMKIKREALAEEIRAETDRSAMILL
ncbi:MAG TPA: AMP-binding protein [Candidatus Acidoferrales bacterium]|nr:AMP-binding protein [Candidatus Acidoferrales bacterium]